MNTSLTRLVVMLLCLLPSITPYTHGDPRRHRRHKHHDHQHRFSDPSSYPHAHAHAHQQHQHQDHAHIQQDHAFFVAPNSHALDNSLYGSIATEEPTGSEDAATGGTHQQQQQWVSQNLRGSAGAGVGDGVGDGVGVGDGGGDGTGASHWAQTYPGTNHHHHHPHLHQQPQHHHHHHQTTSAVNNTVMNVTAQLGGVAFLPCRVGHLGDRQISWIRRRDWRVLSSADVLYSLDPRLSVLHVAGSQDWTLHIRRVEGRDSGVYECHVSTGTGIISLFVNLRVVTPEAHIQGQGQYHVNHGSPITLTCVIQQSPTPPQHVLWYHNGALLNYAHDRPEVEISMRVAGRAVSTLHVEKARDHHSGNYTCEAHNTKPATIRVFVTEGDKTAAVQRIDSGCEGSGASLQETLLLLSLLVAMVAAR